MDGVASSLRADTRDEGGAGDNVRDKCVVMIYDSLAGDSTAGKLLTFYTRRRRSTDIGLVEIRILSERAIGIEKAAYKLMNSSTGNDYRGSRCPELLRNMFSRGN